MLNMLKVIVVTGASKGIGAAACGRFDPPAVIHEALASFNPVGPSSERGDITAAIMFLESASLVTGDILDVDGGQSARHGAA